jgi:RHS repeat-associated protein
VRALLGSTLLVVPALALAVQGPAAGSVSSETLKIPAAPGSLEGLAGKVELAAFSGQASHTFSLPLPRGAGGLQPTFSLNYHGNLGDGPMGPGWSLSAPQIRRSLRHGVPKYDSSDEFEAQGLGAASGRLIPIGNGEYRVLGQGNRCRVIRSETGFRVFLPDGSLWLLGYREEARIAGPNGTFAWLAELNEAPSGKVLRYDYELAQGRAYLKRLRWDSGRVVELSYQARGAAPRGHKAGFPQTWSLLLSRVDVSVDNVRHSRVVLDYERHDQVPKLVSLQRFGLSDEDALPARRFTYRRRASEPLSIKFSGRLAFSLADPNTTLSDVDGDGMPDLLRLDGRRPRWARNTGSSFLDPVPIAGPEVSLSGGQLRVMDVDGDALADLVVQQGGWIPWKASGSGFERGNRIEGSQGMSLAGNQLFADLNGDGVAELLRSGGSGLRVFSGAPGAFAGESSVDLPAGLTGLDISSERLRVQDLSGDGLADMVLLEPAHITIFEGFGNSRFGPGQRVSLPENVANYADLHLRDLDRNGSVDLLIYDAGELRWYPRLLDGGFSPAVAIRAPAEADASSRLLFADLNGNGTIDVVWAAGDEIWALDFVGTTGVGLLESIDSGLGQTTAFGYSPTAQLAAEAAVRGTPWSRHIASVIAVPSRVVVSFADGLTPQRSRLLRPADPIWDPIERSFAGFGRVALLEEGLGDSNTLVTEQWFVGGLGDLRALRGMVSKSEKRNGTGAMFERIETFWSAHLPPDRGGQPLTALPVKQRETQTLFEGGDQPARIESSWVYNDEGDAVESRLLGLSERGGDERTERRDYLYRSDDYHLWGLEYGTSVRSLAGATLQKTRQLFDGAMEPLVAGQASRGWLRRQEGWLESEQRWVLLAASDYDEHHNVVRGYSKGVWREYDYDETGTFALVERLQLDNGGPLETRAAWHPVLGTITTHTNMADVVQNIIYDGLGRLSSRALSGEEPFIVHSYAWEAPAPSTTTVHRDGAAGVFTSHQYLNGAGEKLALINELGDRRSIVSGRTEKDERGLDRRVCEPFYQSGVGLPAEIPAAIPCLTNSFDALGRSVEVVDPSGAWTRTVYSPLSSVESADGLDPVTREADGLNRPIRTQRSVSGLLEITEANYDAAGRLLSIDLQNGAAVHRFGYDSLGRVSWAEDPDQGRRFNSYNDAGRLLQTRNAAGETIDYDYDAAGRVLSENGSKGGSRTYHYDEPKSGSAASSHCAGRLCWAEEPTGELHLTYDAFGKLVSTRRIIDGESAEQRFAFSPSGRQISSQFIGGPSIGYGYDGAGRLKSAAPFWQALEIDAAGRPLSERLGNDVSISTERDARGLPSRQTLRGASGVFSDLRITRHAMGTPVSIDDLHLGGLDQNMQFTYDGAHRLSSAQIAGRSFNFTYDGLQNLRARSVSGADIDGLASGVFSFDSEHPRRLTKAGGQTLSYDAAGRALSVGEKALRWNAFDRMTALSIDGETQTHSYGLGGLRTLTERIDGSKERWFSDNHMRLDDFDHFYIVVGARRIAKVSQEIGQASGGAPLPALPPWIPAALAAASICALLSSKKHRFALRSTAACSLLVTAGACSCSAQASGTFYMHRTYGPGPTLITDQAGELVDERRFAPYGHPIEADLGAHPVGFGDKAVNPTTKWADHGARWLAQDLGRWLAPDPPLDYPAAKKVMAAPWNFSNPYTALGNNPVLFEDGDGEALNIVVGGAVAVGRLAYDGVTNVIMLARRDFGGLQKRGAGRTLLMAAAEGGATLVNPIAGVAAITITAVSEDLRDQAMDSDVNKGVSGTRAALTGMLAAPRAAVGMLLPGISGIAASAFDPSGRVVGPGVNRLTPTLRANQGSLTGIQPSSSKPSLFSEACGDHLDL